MPESIDPLPKVEFAGGYSRQYPHRGHYFRNAVLAIGTLVAFCLITHWLLPFPQIPRVTQKLRYLDAHKNEFDTLFFGSSNVYRGIIPQTFDRLMAEQGTPTRSFNMAVGGMGPPESLYYLEQALRSPPPNLKWVIVEINDLQVKWPRNRLQTQRFLYWHNWQLTRVAVEDIVDPDRKLTRWQFFVRVVQSRAAPIHLWTFIKNLSNLGAVGWRETGEIQPDFHEDEEFARQRGFHAARKNLSETNAKAFVERTVNWAATAHPRALDVVTDDIYRTAAKNIEKSGATPIFVIPPIPGNAKLQFRDIVPAPGPVLAFNHPGKYPALYDIEVRADLGHLTGEGAERFSRAFAERFAVEVALAKPKPGGAR